MDIEEIPINSNIIEDIQDNIPDIQTNIEDIPEITKKSRGRPAGAKNKAKAIPQKTSYKKRVVHESDSEEEDETPPPRRKRPIEPEAPVFDRHALANDVLGILQQQRYQKTTARRQHYAGWFANMS
jgi:hypothetical protein